MIKIINGVVYDNNNKRIELDTIVDDFTPEQEKILVDEGFAVRIGEELKKEEPVKVPQEKLQVQTQASAPKGEDDYLDEEGNFEAERALRLNVENLKTLAKKHGLTDEELVTENNENKTKKEIVALIVEKLSAPKGEDVKTEGNDNDADEGETSETMPNVGDGTDGVA